ncbi:MAG: hypothetical protein Ct9H300mP28_36630 [Pseudomonadota bacterium]|nr:MAG: hypothetical protein Ct9H300mP28_36630 [Pseudomonadota bacterium]
MYLGPQTSYRSQFLQWVTPFLPLPGDISETIPRPEYFIYVCNHREQRRTFGRVSEPSVKP